MRSAEVGSRTEREALTPSRPANPLSSFASTTPDPSGSTAMNICSSDIPVKTSRSEMVVGSSPGVGDVRMLARDRGESPRGAACSASVDSDSRSSGFA